MNMVEFFNDRLRAAKLASGLEVKEIARLSGVNKKTIDKWLGPDPIDPRAGDVTRVARVLGTTVESLVLGEKSPFSAPVLVRNAKGEQVDLDGEAVLVPILAQTVAAGTGQELLQTQEIVGQLPFLRRMLRGGDPGVARALEVRGDSMTGVNIFDGDMVVFITGIVRGDGIYVLQVGDELLVKRVEFDPVSRKIRIMSENTRYPDRIESADGQAVSVVGKVYGWVHAHPY